MFCFWGSTETELVICEGRSWGWEEPGVVGGSRRGLLTAVLVEAEAVARVTEAELKLVPPSPRKENMHAYTSTKRNHAVAATKHI